MRTEWGRAFSALGVILAVLVCCLCSTVGALASSVGISPVNIYLSAANPSSLLTITNQDTQPVSFQIDYYSWNQTDAGVTQLEPTSDIIVFPTLLTLAPGEQRKIRIGSTLHAGATEKSYRIMLQELPPPKTKAVAEFEIRFLSNISLPVFVEPSQTQVSVAITDVKVSHGKLSFRVANTGSVHVLGRAAKVTGTDAAGGTVFTLEPRLWYILAGGSSIVDVALPQKACARVHSLQFFLQFDSTSIKQSATLPSGACTR
jgi:fimbrial chaperone protein